MRCRHRAHNQGVAVNTYRKRCICALVLSAVLVGGAVLARPVAYPAKGQSQQQQQKDDGACYSWAKSNTGIDPAALAANQPPPPSGPAVGGGQRLRGAARGAVGGTMLGGARARNDQQAAAANNQAQAQGAMDTFNRAWGACMQGRGYSVK
jgi:hypothetical protein